MTDISIVIGEKHRASEDIEAKKSNPDQLEKLKEKVRKVE